MKLVFLVFLAYACHHMRKVIAASPQQASAFGYTHFDFWRGDHGFLDDWRRKCAKYNNSNEMAVQTRITGGNLAEANMFPYQVGLLLLQAPKVYQCGGVLISQHFTLTAAHCLYRSTLGKVFLGSTEFANPEKSVAVYNVTYRDFHIYEKYRAGSGFDDIGLIYLNQPVPLSAAVQTIALARSFMTQALLEGETVTVSGWGMTSDTMDRTNLLLNYVDAAVLPHLKCACYYLPGLVKRQKHICTDGSGGRGSCDGDSGGPLTFYYKNVNYLVGLTSFGSAGGCEIGFPSVYTRITSYLGWISWKTGIRVS